MRRQHFRPVGARSLGGLSYPVLALALTAFAVPGADALAGYTFTGGGTTTGTATGDAAVTTLYLEPFSGLIYHSTDGIVFSPDWGGGLTIPALATSTIRVNVATGDGSVVQLGGLLGRASLLQANIQVICGVNTADRVVIDDSTNPAVVTYVIDTLPGFITATGINYDETLSQAFQGGVTLKGGSAGSTFNVASICCGGATQEPLNLSGGAGGDTFVLSAGSLNSLMPLIDGGGGGTDTLDVTAVAGALTVDLAGGTIAGRVTSFTGIEIFKGNGTNHTLRGPNAANTWSITGITAGNLAGGPSFSGFPNFVGGSLVDTFTVAPSSTTTISIDGGLPTAPAVPADSLTLNLTGVTNPVLAPGAPGAGQITFGNRSPLNFSGIECLPNFGGSAQVTVTGGGAICAGDAVLVTATLTGTAPWNLSWSDGVVQNGVLSSPFVRIISTAGTYSVTSLSNPCGAGTTSGNAVVTVSQPPTTATVGGAKTVCTGGTTAPLGGNTPASGTGQWSVASGGTGSFNPGATTPNATFTHATGTGPITLRWTISNPPCTASSADVTVVVNPKPATPVVTVPATVGAGSPNRTASVPNHAGSTYAWAIGNGTITEGQGTSQITFTAGTAGTPLTLSVTETNASGCASAAGNATVTVAPAGAAVVFYTVAPCRVVDTRNTPDGPLAGPSLQPGHARTFSIPDSFCGIPVTARSISGNVTVTNSVSPGYLTLWPADETQPLASFINFSSGQTRANNAIVQLSRDGSGAFEVLNGSAGTVHFILDVNGYFQ